MPLSARSRPINRQEKTTTPLLRLLRRAETLMPVRQGHPLRRASAAGPVSGARPWARLTVLLSSQMLTRLDGTSRDFTGRIVVRPSQSFLALPRDAYRLSVTRASFLNLLERSSGWRIDVEGFSSAFVDCSQQHHRFLARLRVGHVAGQKPLADRSDTRAGIHPQARRDFRKSHCCWPSLSSRPIRCSIRLTVT